MSFVQRPPLPTRAFPRVTAVWIQTVNPMVSQVVGSRLPKNQSFGSDRLCQKETSKHSTPMARFNSSEIVFLGDTKAPDVIFNDGGFISRGNCQNPNTHQAGSGTTFYISCSRVLSVAKGFASSTGFVYGRRNFTGQFSKE